MRKVFLPLVIAVAAAIMYTLIVSNAQKKLHAAQKTVKVFVPIRDIKEHEIIKRDYITPVEIPAAYVHKDAFTYSSGADFKAIENAVARIQIPKGNQISKYAVTSLSPEAGLSSKIPVQYRGYMLPVRADTARMVKPDDKVDVLVAFDAIMKNGSHQRVVVTLLQNVTVLGVGTNLGQGLDVKSASAMKSKEEEAAAFSDNDTLALALTPKDAQYLALARSQAGEDGISVVLRSRGDMNVHIIDAATFDRLFQPQ